MLRNVKFAQNYKCEKDIVYELIKLIEKSGREITQGTINDYNVLLFCERDHEMFKWNKETIELGLV